jgi:hypothetical protein
MDEVDESKINDSDSSLGFLTALNVSGRSSSGFL